jgi:hypothetical protein
MAPRKLILAAALCFALPPLLLSQAENVPATDPVYIFLKRMEVRGILERYRDAILPLSRREIGEFLLTVDQNRDKLTGSEKDWARRYLDEFRYEVRGNTEGTNSLISTSAEGMTSGSGGFFSDTQKYLYAARDTNLTIFVNGLLTFDARRISGDAVGSAHAEFVQGGLRARGTITGHLGYSLQAVNAQFWGNRELLARDPSIAQTEAIGATDIQNFDAAEGHVRYDGGIVSAEVGTERVLWGNGYDQKMIMSDNVRPFPFLRADLRYKSLRYTFIHAWLLGFPRPWTDFVSADSALKIKGPSIADKYVAAHRLEFSFPRLFTFAFQEMVVYSNRSPDLAYLTPLILLESAQRSRGERDNGLWSFDIQTHFTPGIELAGTILFDDLHLNDFFKNRYYNKNAYQLGFFLTDPFMFRNTSLMVEWTRVQPFVFSHDYSIEDTYTSYGASLGPRIGPNSESWFIRGDLFPAKGTTLSLTYFYGRHGDNISDAAGNLIMNAGGDIEQGHRPADPITVDFLAGKLVTTQRVQFIATYEPVYQIWIDGWYEYERIETGGTGAVAGNGTFGMRVRTEF